MYVCLCKGITEAHIHTAVADGMTDYREVRLALGLSSCCGKCAPHAREVFRAATAQPAFDSSLFYCAETPRQHSLAVA